MTILERFEQAKPDTAKANTNGKDTTPIGDDNPRGEFSPSKDLSRDESRLSQARGGQLRSKPYSDTTLGDK